MTEVSGNRYQALERVGDVGMATVCRGTDRVLRRDVAIQIMPPATRQQAGRARVSTARLSRLRGCITVISSTPTTFAVAQMTLRASSGHAAIGWGVSSRQAAGEPGRSIRGEASRPPVVVQLLDAKAVGRAADVRPAVDGGIAAPHEHGRAVVVAFRNAGTSAAERDGGSALRGASGQRRAEGEAEQRQAAHKSSDVHRYLLSALRVHEHGHASTGNVLPTWTHAAKCVGAVCRGFVKRATPSVFARICRNLRTLDAPVRPQRLCPAFRASSRPQAGAKAWSDEGVGAAITLRMSFGSAGSFRCRRNPTASGPAGTTAGSLSR